jgi:hypothetical protein
MLSSAMANSVDVRMIPKRKSVDATMTALFQTSIITIKTNLTAPTYTNVDCVGERERTILEISLR